MSDEFQMIKIFLYKAGGVVKVSVKEKQQQKINYFDDTDIYSKNFIQYFSILLFIRIDIKQRSMRFQD